MCPPGHAEAVSCSGALALRLVCHGCTAPEPVRKIGALESEPMEPQPAFAYGPPDDVSRAARLWPVPLAVGILSIILGFIVLSYDTTSVTVVSILIGVALLFTGIGWLMLAFLARPISWFFAIGGVLITVGGIVAFAYPDPTLKILGLILGWAMVVSGAIGIVLSLMDRDREHWWLDLIGALLTLALGGWAVREANRSVILLLTIVGVYCVIRGIAGIAEAFRLRRLAHAG